MSGAEGEQGEQEEELHRMTQNGWSSRLGRRRSGHARGRVEHDVHINEPIFIQSIYLACPQRVIVGWPGIQHQGGVLRIIYRSDLVQSNCASAEVVIVCTEVEQLTTHLGIGAKQMP